MPRSGSTWLQRTLTSTGDVLIWGESIMMYPHDRRMLTQPDPATNATTNPHDLHKFRKDKANMWMAVLRPEQVKVDSAHKAYVERVYGQGAKDEGFDRWGSKETLWDGNMIQFILESWPKSKIIFLTRNFHNAFASRFKGGAVQNANADADVKEYAGFMVKHGELILQYKNHNQCKWVKYEDLYATDTLSVLLETRQKLINWCGLNQPDDEQCGPQISTHVWGSEHDIYAYSPETLQSLWPFRDKIIYISKQLGYKVKI